MAQIQKLDNSLYQFLLQAVAMKTFPLVLVVLSLAVFEPGSGSIITDANCLCPAEMVGTYVCGDELKSSDCFRNRAYNCTLPGKAVGSDMICSNVPCITNPNKRSATCTAYTVYVNCKFLIWANVFRSTNPFPSNFTESHFGISTTYFLATIVYELFLLC